MNSLLLTLKGSTRSWGSTSVGDDRSTEFFPTASGILGLAGACMGVNSSNFDHVNAWYKGFHICSLSALSYKHREQPDLNKVHYPKVFTDYQTIRKSQNMDNKTRKETIVSLRHYLSDALDVAAIIPAHSDAEEWLEQLAFAVQQPYFTPYLGRRCNTLSAPLVEPGEQVISAQDIDEISNLLFWRLSSLRIGNWSPDTCELRTPFKLNRTTDLTKSWQLMGEKTIPDHRRSKIRFFKNRQVYCYTRKMEE